jgi:predicted O-linked N-acetylglucosamine transferase (SPINDLY family)
MPPPALTHPHDASAANAQQAWLSGQQLARRGRWADAARRFAEARRLQPRDVLYALNLADARLKSGQPEAALAAAQAAARLEPANEIARALQVNAMMVMNRYDEIAELLEGVDPERLDEEMLVVRGVAQVHGGHPQAAVGSFMQVLFRDPARAPVHYRLGLAFNALGLKAEAAECFRTALLLGLGPLEVGVRDLLAFYEREICDWSRGEDAVQRLRQSIGALPQEAAVETSPFAHVTLLDSPQEQLKVARVTARHFARLVQPLPARRPQPRERLRIGYVSADFHRHATAFLMAELFERHDRARFEVFVYSHGRDDDSPVRRRIRAAADHFVDARPMTVPRMAERIRADGIDILVDLKGYTQDARPALFACRPAPVQVAYLGYPGTTGSASIDYLVADPWVTPLHDGQNYSEKLAQLPGCYQCNDGTRPLPVAPPRSSQGLPDDALVLCGFNQPYKISPEVFDVWCRLLQRLPQAVLWLLAWNDQAPANLRREAAARGVDPARLVFAASVPQAEHLDRVACADLFLDTWPCNGHTTVSDMLWAGVPVVTWSGKTFASRVAGSLLHAVGAGELVTDSPERYESLVADLASDPGRREHWARHLRAQRQQADLFSSRVLAPRLEALYERMWANALAGQAPRALAAAPA